VLDRAVKTKLQIILCQSDEDALALREAGFKSIRVIKRVEDLYRFSSASREYELDSSLTVFDAAVLAYPPASAGLRDDVAMRLGDVKCTWAEFPTECSTPALLAAAEGPAALHNAIVAAKPMWTDEVCRMSDVPEPAPEVVYETGLPALDRHGFRIVRPAFWVLIGPYGSGKSVLFASLAQLSGANTAGASCSRRLRKGSSPASAAICAGTSSESRPFNGAKRTSRALTSRSTTHSASCGAGAGTSLTSRSFSHASNMR
jgi:hypothetical protein